MTQILVISLVSVIFLRGLVTNLSPIFSENGLYDGSVTGTVTDDRKHPIQGATVRIADPWTHNQDIAHTKTDKKGMYKFSKLYRDAIYRVHAVDPANGRYTDGESFRLKDGDATIDLTIDESTSQQ